MFGSVSHLRPIQVEFFFFFVAFPSGKRIETTKKGKAKAKAKEKKGEVKNKLEIKHKKGRQKINKKGELFFLGAVLCVCIKGRFDDGIPFDVKVKSRKRIQHTM